ncbi:hypothetical protein [Parvibaculum sp.]|uniref:hypothetical protein n=1 Tax=Parvibaculum sp. TaxID=2024848 RepID=UPI001DAA4FBA|nr:hypothetical protein [Parvibaculum sp.]MBX3488860.1 hypothetical protein [Parvibaculum sp.]
MTTASRKALPVDDPRIKGNVWVVFDEEGTPIGNFALREGDGAEEAIAMSFEVKPSPA